VGGTSRLPTQSAATQTPRGKKGVAQKGGGKILGSTFFHMLSPRETRGFSSNEYFVKGWRIFRAAIKTKKRVDPFMRDVIKEGGSADGRRTAYRR